MALSTVVLTMLTMLALLATSQGDFDQIPKSFGNSDLRSENSVLLTMLTMLTINSHLGMGMRRR